MTNYTIWGQAAPPSGATSAASAVRTDGYQFTVSSSCTLTGYWFYVPAGETSLAGSAYSGSLWTTVTGTTGTLVSGPTVGSGTFTAGAWNFIPVSGGPTLSPGVTYVMGMSHPNLLEFLHNYWTTGGGGAAGRVSGIINVPSALTAVNAAQQPNTGSVNTFPPAASAETWYGVDVQLTTGGGPPPAPSALVFASMIL